MYVRYQWLELSKNSAVMFSCRHRRSACLADLGAAFEHHVGRQLAQAPHRSLVPELVYGHTEKRTVDWFLVFDELLVLIEVKAPRLTEAARLGDAAALARDIDRTISKARRQIDRTAALLRSPPPELLAACVPTDRLCAGSAAYGRRRGRNAPQGLPVDAICSAQWAGRGVGL